MSYVKFKTVLLQNHWKFNLLFLRNLMIMGNLGMMLCLFFLICRFYFIFTGTRLSVYDMSKPIEKTFHRFTIFYVIPVML